MHTSVMDLNMYEFTNKDGLWWTDSSQMIVPDAFDLRQFISCEMHDSPCMEMLASRDSREQLSYCTPGQPLLLM